ncbi:response regulator receiver domain-containing protein [Rhizobium subbaraonis]|uniref:Response regulator receiver domain-containing protein n=1 Tax=Rhizobium subbaraonis TaxID=908946 RepID=A0A285UTZ4_9HYPH|nr:response regulator receiver domain-containing protein [Rhizobium subbaraonis]
MARSLFIVEDDTSFAKALKRSFERRGYDVDRCSTLQELELMLASSCPQFAVIDLKLAGESGLECVKAFMSGIARRRLSF